MNVIAIRDSFKTEISSYDVLTGRADRFGEGEYDNRYVFAPPDRPTYAHPLPAVKMHSHIFWNSSVMAFSDPSSSIC